jgi:hypothetical protein
MEVHFESNGAILDEQFKLQGQGRTAEERRSSMQQQLAALQSSSSFLAPASWPSTRCLTCLHLDIGSARHDASYLEAAMQAPSLLELHITMPTTEAGTTASTLLSISRLTNLTFLAIDMLAVTEGASSHQRPILEAIAHISSLQSLSIDHWLLGSCMDDESARVPPSWARLTALTALTVLYADLHLADCAQLVSLHDLNLRDASETFGDLASLLPLTCLTSLIGPDDQASGAFNAEEGTVVVPQQWKEGLRLLHWPVGCSATLGVVSQLTALTWLSLNDLSPSFEACRSVLCSGCQRGDIIAAAENSHHCGAKPATWCRMWATGVKMVISSMGPACNCCPLQQHATSACRVLPR